MLQNNISNKVWYPRGGLLQVTTILAMTAPFWGSRIRAYCKRLLVYHHPKPHPKDLRELSDSDRQMFFGSFDTVITDIDGTLYRFPKPISGAIETLKNLQSCGKKILFATNNTVISKKKMIEQLDSLNYSASLDDIIVPTDGLIWYFRDIMKFDRVVFAIGAPNFIERLNENGIKTLTAGSDELLHSHDTFDILWNLNPNVEAVIVDFDLNLNYLKITQALQYLKRKNVIFFVSCKNFGAPLSKERELPCLSGEIADLLSKRTGLIPKLYGKSSEILRDYLLSSYQIKNPKRILFIGDSLESDIEFARLCGFQSLWVSSGVDVHLYNNSCGESPDYYLPDLGKMPPCTL